MFTFEKLNKLIGIRKTSDFSNPRVGDSLEIEFPINSALLWYHKEYIGNNLFKKLKKKPKVMIQDKYFKEKRGKYRRLSVDKSALIQKVKKLDEHKEFEFTTSKSKLFLTDRNIPIIFDFTRLDYVYKYEHYKNAEYDKYMNLIDTVLMASIEPDRQTSRNLYITIPIPKVLPSLSDIKLALKVDSFKTIEYAKSKEMLIIIELIKLLDNKTFKKSIFSRITNIVESDIKLVFGLNGNVSVCSLPDLLALSKDNEVPFSKIKGIDSKNAINTFMKYIILITEKYKQKLSVLEKETSTDVSLTGHEEEDIDTLIESHNERHKEVDPIEENIDTPKEKISLESKLSKEVTVTDSAKTLFDMKLEQGLITKNHYEKAIKALEYTEQIEKDNQLTNKDYELDIKSYPDDIIFKDKNMLLDTNVKFARAYLKTGYKKHQRRVFNKFASVGIVMTNHEVEKKSDIAYRENMHAMTYINSKGREITLRQIVPDIDDEGKFLLNKNEMVLGKQEGDVPIKKISNVEVTLNSFYSKIFVTKAISTRDNIADAITKQLRVLNDDKNSNIDLIIVGKCIVKNERVPYIYQVISRNLKSVKYAGVSFYFDHRLREKRFDLTNESKYGIALGKRGKTMYYINFENELIKVDNGKADNLGSFLKYLGVDEVSLPIEYASIQLMGTKIPLVLILSYFDGLENVLETLDVTYTKHDAKERVIPNDDQYLIRFKEYKLIVTKGWYDIVVSGLTRVKDLKYYDFLSLNNKIGIIDLFNNMNINSKRLSVELDLMKSLWIDPMTEDVLRHMKEPLTLLGLFYRSAVMLKDDFHMKPKDVSGLMIKGYDRVNGMLYHIMAKAISDNAHKEGNRQTKLTLNPYELKSMLAEDGTFELVEDMNPFTRMKQDEIKTLIGKFGRSKGSIAGKDRVFDKTNMGYTSEATKDSGEVGVTSYLPASSIMDNSLGLMTAKDDLSISQVVSSSMMMHVGSDTDDNKRALYISVQNASVVSTNSQKVWPIGTGYEYIIPYRMDKKFVMYVKSDATVLRVTNNLVEIMYKDKKKEIFKLNSWITKAIGGLAYKHDLKTGLKVGDKLKEYDIIYYDTSFFGLDLFDDKRIVYKGGDIVLVALDETSETYEDSSTVSREFSKRFSSNLTKEISFTIPNTAKLKDIAKVGDSIKFNQTLINYINSDFEREKLDNKSSQKIIDDLQINALRSEAKGHLFRIEVYYNSEISTMSKSIQTLVNEVNKSMLTNKGFTGRVDSTYSVDARPLAEDDLQVIFYIEKANKLNIADKAVLANQLKLTVGEVSDMIKTESGEEVDVRTSSRSIGARIVNSPEDVGSATTVLIHGTRKAIEIYKS